MKEMIFLAVCVGSMSGVILVLVIKYRVLVERKARAFKKRVPSENIPE
jgi:hypothetical protein